jgi:hypothetical protein
MARNFEDKEKAKEASRKAGKRGPGLLTRTVKAGFTDTFNELQDDPNFSLPVWARANPTEFYKLAAKLIPTELTGAGGVPLFPPIIEMPEDGS